MSTWLLLRQRLAGCLKTERKQEKPQDERDRGKSDRNTDGVTMRDSRANHEGKTRADESADRRGKCERAAPAGGRILLRQPQRVHGEIRAADSKKEEADEKPGHGALRQVEGQPKTGADRNRHDDEIDRQRAAAADLLGDPRQRQAAENRA